MSHRNSIDVEQAVLSSILLDNQSIYKIPFLTPEDFTTPTHNQLYRTALNFIAQSKPVDVATLTAEGFPFRTIVELHDIVPTAANIEHYAKAVKDFSRRRALREVAAHITALVDDGVDADECVREAEREILSIRNDSGEKGRARKVGELSNELMEVVRKRIEDGGGFFGKRTGLNELDSLLGGMQDGETLVLAGRPSSGKSSTATQIILNRAKEGDNCLFHSLEMSHSMCVMRMISQLSSISMNRIKGGNVRDVGLEKLRAANEELSSYPIWIDDTGAISIPNIRATARRIAAEAGKLDLLVVDYLQLCGGNGKDGRERDVAEASAGLKAIAKEFSMPVIILSQLNRSCEMRDDKRPRLSDLRESGAIEQDADAVVMVYRPAVYSTENDESELELIVRKNRNGPLGTAYAKWDPESMRVSN